VGKVFSKSTICFKVLVSKFLFLPCLCFVSLFKFFLGVFLFAAFSLHMLIFFLKVFRFLFLELTSIMVEFSNTAILSHLEVLSFPCLSGKHSHDTG
jgi:hypothetical protein